MKKIGVSLFVILCTWSGTSLYARHNIETNYNQHLTAFSNNNHFGLKVKKHTFDAGAFSSVATTIFELKKNACDEEATVSFTVEERFKHDLISGLGAVKSDINIIINDSKIENALNELTKNAKKDILVITGHYGLTGNATYLINSPAFTVSEGNKTLIWQGMTGNITVNSKGYNTHFSAPSLSLNENTNFMSMSGFKFDSNALHSDIGLNTGNLQFSLEQLELNAEKAYKGAKFSIEKINLSNTTSLNGALATIVAENNIGRIKAAALPKSTSINSKITLRNLDAKGLLAFNEGFEQFQNTCHAKVADYDEAFKAILKGKPELIVDHINIAIGEMKLGASGHMKGVDLDKMSDTVNTLSQINGLDGLDIKLKLQANQAVAAEFNTIHSGFANIFNRLVDADIISQENNDYALDIDYQSKELQFNGLSLNDLKLALAASDNSAIPEDEEVEEEKTDYPDWYDPNRIY